MLTWNRFLRFEPNFHRKNHRNTSLLPFLKRSYVKKHLWDDCKVARTSLVIEKIINWKIISNTKFLYVNPRFFYPKANVSRGESTYIVAVTFWIHATVHAFNVANDRLEWNQCTQKHTNTTNTQKTQKLEKKMTSNPVKVFSPYNWQMLVFLGLKRQRFWGGHFFHIVTQLWQNAHSLVIVNNGHRWPKLHNSCRSFNCFFVLNNYTNHFLMVKKFAQTTPRWLVFTTPKNAPKNLTIGSLVTAISFHIGGNIGKVSDIWLAVFYHPGGLHRHGVFDIM